MSNIIPFSADGAANLPAHLANVFGDEGNIAPRQTVNQLSYRGKVWRRIVNGEEVQLTRLNNDTGEQEPIPIVQVIILDHNKQRSRSFFEGNYEEGKNAKPRCYSADGVKPDASVKDPIAPTCATCPNAVKGSKITENGKQTTACSPFKRVAIAPSNNIGDHPPLLLKMAQTSIWAPDPAEEAKGWYAWDDYLNMLRARGAKHTAMVETRIKFDLKVAYPKLLFSAARWLNPEEALAARKLLDDPAVAGEIEAIINGAGDADGVMGQTAGAVGAAGTNHQNAATTAQSPTPQAAAPAPTQAPAPAPTQAPKPPAPPKPPAAPKPPTAPPKIVKKMTEKADGFTLEQMLAEGWTEDQLIAEGMLIVTEEVAAPPKPPRAPKKPPAAPAPASTDDSGGFPPPPAPAAAAPTPAAPVAATASDAPAGLSDLLANWDDGAGDA